MHDIKLIRENPEKFDAELKNRGCPPMSEEILQWDDSVRTIKRNLEQKLYAKNMETKEAEMLKTSGQDGAFKEMCNLIAQTKIFISRLEKRTRISNDVLKDLLMKAPNLAMDDVPIGKDENDNKELRRWGDIPQFGDYTPKEHFNILSASKGMDFETAGNISGSRFVLLSGAIARVHRALAQFMLDLHINEHGLMEINAPVIVNSETMRGTGQLPKFAADCYYYGIKDERMQAEDKEWQKILDEWDKPDEEQTPDDEWLKQLHEAKLNSYKWLIPTSEVPLTNIVAGKILNNDQLPKRYCAHSLCFRQEAGAAGRDTTGMLRQHQFEKVEMVSITTPEKSREELDIMTTKAEAVLKKLKLPYRTVVLCTGDMGFSAQRTHDIEVWLPGQNRYREISSVSVCGDFQARRMNARFREKDGDKPQFVHTLNGSGVAVGRCLIAVLENGQQKDGSVKLPKALHPYLGGKDTINPDGILEKAT